MKPVSTFAQTTTGQAPPRATICPKRGHRVCRDQFPTVVRRERAARQPRVRVATLEIASLCSARGQASEHMGAVLEQPCCVSAPYYLLDMAKMTALISGAGIAGPTLASWLRRRGFEPVLVERAPSFRAGGYVIDVWVVGFDVVERMKLLPRLYEMGYLNDRIAFVRQNGALRSTFGGSVLRRALGGRFLSIQRGDLARVIYDTIKRETETAFGDEIIGMALTGDSIEARFRRGSARSFDFVIGADGLHCAVRRLAFDSPDYRRL